MSMVGWELGVGDEVSDIFGAENRDDLDAINDYIVGLPVKADELKSAGKVGILKYNKFQNLYQDWKSFYKYVTDSWYVSDSDLNVAKKKRDDINMTLMPEETKKAQQYSSQAKGGVDTSKYESETKSFWERHWLAITGVVLGSAAAVYLGGSALAYA